MQSACGWIRYKFGIDLSPAEVADLELAAFKQLLREPAEAAYHEKETEYPVMAGLYHFTTRDPSGHKRYDREALVDWARERFDVELEPRRPANKQRDEIRALLVEHSRQYLAEADRASAEARSQLEELLGAEDLWEKAAIGAQRRRPAAIAFRLAGRAVSTTNCRPRRWPGSSRAQLENRLVNAVEEQYRPEMRKMERALVLQLLDTAWKDHLLAMDHLRSSVGLRGYAQVDPKVEYKREGMRIFEAMWDSVGERVTDLVFRMEQLDEGFVGSTWSEAEARHDEAHRPAKSPPSSRPPSTAPRPTTSPSRSATASSASAATILAPAAAGRSSRTAACGRADREPHSEAES